MKIKHLTLMAGPTGTYTIGTERDVSDAEGRELVAGNYAIEITRRQPENAALPAAENAALTPAEQDAADRLANIATATPARKRNSKAPVSPAPTSEAISAALPPAPPPAESSVEVSLDTPADPPSADVSTTAATE